MREVKSHHPLMRDEPHPKRVESLGSRSSQSRADAGEIAPRVGKSASAPRRPGRTPP
jgi:hypothetical protein